MEQADEALIRSLFPGASKSTLARNAKKTQAPQPLQYQPQAADIPGVHHGTRIRQSSEALNKLEAAWFSLIQNRYPNYPPVRPQSKRYRLGNGIWYKPDFTASIWPDLNGPARETCWEVKGPHAFRGGFENLKVAAATFPEVRWILVWKQAGEWFQQDVKP